jgi:hypothetical protein
MWFLGKMNLAPGIFRTEFLIFCPFLAFFRFLFLCNHRIGSHYFTQGCPEKKKAFGYWALWLLKRGISIAVTASVLLAMVLGIRGIDWENREKERSGNRMAGFFCLPRKLL